MSKKTKILLTTYITAALVALSLFSWSGQRSLSAYRRSAVYSARHAYEETVTAVNNMSLSLAKSLYAVDGSMCSRICSEVYANALAAEAALSSLPFSTQELEQLTAFLNYAGDYAYTLGRQAAEPGEEQLAFLAELSTAATQFSQKLKELQGGINSGELLMDSLQQPLGNIKENAEAGLLSAGLLEYENGLEELQMPEYEGKYTEEEKAVEGELSEEEMKALAARFAGIDAQRLKEEYAYNGTEGRKCYSAEGVFICVSPAGVESLGQTRLVSEALIDAAQAEQTAGQYLKDHGFENLSLSEKNQNGYITVMEYAVNENGIMWPDNHIKIGIAMDDGSVYIFNVLNYHDDASGAKWSIDEKEAKKAVPESLTVQSAEKQIKAGEGCYNFRCMNDMGENVNILIDGKTGKQMEISIN